MQPEPVTKNTVVELLLLGLAQSKLKDMGLQALRGVLQSDPRLAVLDGEVDVQCVWEVLESQPDFDPVAARPPFCFLKSLEQRLQVAVKLPAALRDISESDIIREAQACRVKRDDIDRAVAGEDGSKRRWRDPSVHMRPVAPAAPRPELTPRRKVLLGISAVVAVASVFIVGHTLLGEVSGGAKFTPMDSVSFAGEIPIRSAVKWGGEVHAALADPGWMKLPEDRRRRQLEGALQKLSGQQLGILIIEDEAKRQRATAQLFGQPPRVYIRFY